MDAVVKVKIEPSSSGDDDQVNQTIWTSFADVAMPMSMMRRHEENGVDLASWRRAPGDQHQVKEEWDSDVDDDPDDDMQSTRCLDTTVGQGFTVYRVKVEPSSDSELLENAEQMTDSSSTIQINDQLMHHEAIMKSCYQRKSGVNSDIGTKDKARKLLKSLKIQLFKCQVCNMSFGKNEMHRSTHNKDHLYMCTKCKNGYCTKYPVRNYYTSSHMDEHDQESVFKDYGRDQHLQRNTKSHTRRSQLTCTICNKEGSDKTQHSENIRSHKSESSKLKSKKKPKLKQDLLQKEVREKQNCVPPEEQSEVPKQMSDFACHICGKEFACKAKVIRHLSSHSNIKPFTCDVCGVKFKQKAHLAHHKKLHTGEGPWYYCLLCDSKFRFIHHLKTHLMMHSGEKLFHCSVCDKGFIRKDRLRSHETTHTGQYRWHCEVCNKGFTQNYGVKVHMRKHTGEHPFVCKVCGKRFRYRKSLDYHRVTHSSERPFICDVCQKSFKTKDNLKIHKRVHEKAHNKKEQEK